MIDYSQVRFFFEQNKTFIYRKDEQMPTKYPRKCDDSWVFDAGKLYDDKEEK